MIGIFFVVAALLTLSNEDFQQNEISESFISILVGFFIGLIITKSVAKVFES